MTKTLKIIACSILALVLGASCTGTPQDVEHDTASGVVLVQNQSYYEVVLPGGQQLWFSAFDEQQGLEGLTTNPDSIKSALSYGTAFFVDDKGLLVTNNHVVNTTAQAEQVTKSLRKVLDQARTEVYRYYQQLQQRYQQLAAQAGMMASYAGGYDLVTMTQLSALQAEMQRMQAYYYQLQRVQVGSARITYHSKISIALNNSKVTSPADFTPCEVLAADATHDLALVRLATKKTPSGRYIFDIPSGDPLEDYSLWQSLLAKMGSDKNATLMMSSFNLGPNLAVTTNGLQSQFNQGNLSQRSDDRILYSIPSLPGSSGSPVLNLEGEIVAVNYAGLNGTQGFNYGIRVKWLQKLMADYKKSKKQ